MCGRCDDAARHHEALRHAARQRVDVGFGAVGQVELLEQLVGPRPRRALVEPEIAAVVVEVLPDREAAVERVGLRDHADRLFGQGRLGDHIDAAHAGAAGARHDARREHADGGRLAGAVGAEQAEDLAGGDRQVERLDGADAAREGLREPDRHG